MQRVLERGLNPLLSMLPLSLFATTVLFDFGALVSGFHVFGEISYWVLATSLLISLVALTALLVDFTTAPVGSVAHRVRGIASATTTGMVVVFTLAWYLRADGNPAGSAPVFLLELFAFVGGIAGSVAARSTRPVRGLFEARPPSDGWPFSATR